MTIAVPNGSAARESVALKKPGSLMTSGMVETVARRRDGPVMVTDALPSLTDAPPETVARPLGGSQLPTRRPG